MLHRLIEIERSSRHQKIIGDFGENLVCNWLSRSGFEVSIVDHTGIDVVAYNPKTRERLGITVKSRTRSLGSERHPITFLRHGKKGNDRKKLMDACKAFGCTPWIAVYVETRNHGDLFLTSLKNYDSKYRSSTNRVVENWGMSKLARKLYDKDVEVKHLGLEFQGANWFQI